MLRISRSILNKQLTETIKKSNQARRSVDWREIRRQDGSKINKLKKDEFEARNKVIVEVRKKQSKRRVLKKVSRVIGIAMGLGIMSFLMMTGVKSFQNTPAQEYKKAPLKQGREKAAEAGS